MRLETERLILRPLEPGDAEDLFAVHSDPTTFETVLYELTRAEREPPAG